MKPSLSALSLHGSVDETLALAQLCDRLGYNRFWHAENHPQPSASLLSALIAGTTERIRVGPAGVQLNFATPMVVALDYGVLDENFDGRIDLGFCASWLGSPLLDDMLDGRPESHRANYLARAERLVELVRSNRRSMGRPQLWSHGTGAQSAALAARAGLAYGYSLFHQQSTQDPQHCRAYRQVFVPSAERERPYVAIATAGVIAPDMRSADELKARWRNEFHVVRVAGTPTAVADELQALGAHYEADEVVFADLTTDSEVRRWGYHALCDAWA